MGPQTAAEVPGGVCFAGSGPPGFNDQRGLTHTWHLAMPDNFTDYIYVHPTLSNFVLIWSVPVLTFN